MRLTGDVVLETGAAALMPLVGDWLAGLAPTGLVVSFTMCLQDRREHSAQSIRAAGNVAVEEDGRRGGGGRRATQERRYHDTTQQPGQPSPLKGLSTLDGLPHSGAREVD